MHRSDSRPQPADASSRAVAEVTDLLVRYERSSESALAALESHDVHALAVALDAREQVARELPLLSRSLGRSLSAASLEPGATRADVERLLAPALQAAARATALDARLLGGARHAREELGDEIARLPAAPGVDGRRGSRDAIVHVDVLL